MATVLHSSYSTAKDNPVSPPNKIKLSLPPSLSSVYRVSFVLRQKAISLFLGPAGRGRSFRR